MVAPSRRRISAQTGNRIGINNASGLVSINVFFFIGDTSILKVNGYICLSESSEVTFGVVWIKPVFKLVS